MADQRPPEPREAGGIVPQLKWARRILLPPVILLASAYLCYLDIVWRDWYWVALWALLGWNATDRIIKNARGVVEGRAAEPPGTIEGRPTEPGVAGEDRPGEVGDGRPGEPREVW